MLIGIYNGKEETSVQINVSDSLEAAAAGRGPSALWSSVGRFSLPSCCPLRSAPLPPLLPFLLISS